MLKLSDMTVGQADKVAEKVIEMFLRESEILQDLPFDNAVSPSGGSTLVYGYVQEKLPSPAAFRAIGSEYTPSNATVEKKTVDLKIFGGSFQIDRVLKSIESKIENMDRQVKEKIRGAVQLFHDTLINGDIASNSLGFDGLDKFLVGTSTEMNTSNYIDLSTKVALEANASEFYEILRTLINKTNADAILVNEDMKTKIETVARVLGYRTETEEAFGTTITKIGNVKIADLKNKVSVSESEVNNETVYNVTEEPIIGITERSVGTGLGTYSLTTDTAINTKKTYYTRSGSGTEQSPYEYTKVTSPVVANIATYYEQNGVYVTGLTDIYAVKYSVDDGFCGVTITGDKAIDVYLPDFTTPGAVKTGEVEMVAAVALKSSKSAGVLRNIKIR